jgi:hypothetical protein
MTGRSITVVAAISLAGLLLARPAAASKHPRLIGQVVSPAVKDMPPQSHHSGDVEEKERRHPHRPGSGDVADPVVQTSTTTTGTAQTIGSFEGLGASFPGFSVTALPPDPNMAVGPNHIVQWVNNAFVVFNKSGAPLIDPVGDDTFWGGLSSTCEQLGGFSDPIVQYDRVADRWIVGEVAIPLLPPLIGQFAQCFAVSTTPDPTGPYFQWAYGFGTTVPDYPKIGVWPDGYYVTWNIFENGATFTGAEACAWNRGDLLGGIATPRNMCFDLPASVASLLPSDVDGPTPPPAGSPNFLANIDPDLGRLNLWRFHVDWVHPASSTFIGPIVMTGAAPFAVPCSGAESCIPQPGTTMVLDSLGDRLMYRLAYRNFGDHESIVANHSVAAGSATGVRWYEIRNPNGSPTIYQQGTFAPDADSRWMASIAMDQTGNVGIGYSVSSSGTFPSIRYSGWEIGNPLGTLQAETTLAAGGGSQTGYTRWGDYSAMRIDPSDDCLFWYTQEYQATTVSANWSTRIGSFRFPSCGQTQTSTTTTVASSAPTSTFGQPVTFTATVSPAASTGTVQFFDGGSSLGTAPLGGGSAALTTSTLAVGGHSIHVTYNGDATHSGSTSSSITQTVNAITTSTALISSLDPSTFGQAVTLTATVSPSSGPTGTVQFFDGATPLGNVALGGGTAALTTSTLAAGSHSITAIYSGDANYGGSTSSAVTQTVNAVTTTSTTLTSSLNPSVFGQAVTLTATVSPSSGPTGTVQFLDGATPLGTVALSGGSASLTTATLATGSHSVTAVYSGDTGYGGSTSSPVAQIVNKVTTATTLTSSLNPSAFGQAVTLTATVSPSSGPTGTVQFFDGATPLGTVALGSGTASLTTSTLAAGAHSITAIYSGDTNYAGSTSSAVTQTVNKVTTATTLTSSLNPSTFGQAVTLTATVSPSGPTGTVQFFDGATPLGTVALSGGTASLTTATLVAGAHSITATYSGDASFNGSTSAAVTQTVNKITTATALTSSLDPSVFGQPVTFTATVNPSSGPTGMVQFFDGPTPLGAVSLSGGTASLTTATLAVGSHFITAVYSGDASYGGSTSVSLTQIVATGIVDTTTALTSSLNPSAFGQMVTFTATISPSAGATGTVTFRDGGSVIGTSPLAGGVATFTTSSLAVGGHSITAQYSGDGAHNGSTSPALAQTVNKAATATTLTSGLNPSKSGREVVFTATVSPSAATGTVQFLDGSTVLGTATLSGDSASFATSALGGGKHLTTAVYGGDASFSTSTSAVLTQTVTGKK